MGRIDGRRGGGGRVCCMVGAGLLFCLGCLGATETRVPDRRTPHRADVQDVQPRPSVPYSLTISGGLSLGAYEAGMNWALVEWMRSRRLRGTAGVSDRAVPELVGVTGASAGAINALFSAVRWCEGSGAVSSLEDKIFARSWLPIGFEEMLPVDPAEYASVRDPEWDPDFLISRKQAFREVIADLRDRLRSSAYRADCRVPVSLIVTKVRPGRVRVDSLSASTQRYVVAMMAETVATAEGHGLRFRLNRGLAKTSAQQLVGNILWLSPQKRSDDEWEVPAELVLDALQASSAHPSSFGPVLLRQCAPSSTCRASHRHDSQTCRDLGRELGVKEPFTECAEPFNDGGAFDNVPIGAAVAQVEREPELDPHFPPRYIYMDPGVEPEPGGPGRADLPVNRIASPQRQLGRARRKEEKTHRGSEHDRRDDRHGRT